MQEEQRIDESEGLADDKPETLEETVARAYDSLAEEPSGDGLTEAEAHEAAPQSEASLAPTEDRPRDEHGRFVKTEALPPKGKKRALPATPEQGPPVEAPPDTDSVLAPPSTFSAEEQAEFTQLPREMQAAVSRIMRGRDERFHSTNRELNQREEVLEHREREFSDLYRTVAHYIPRWGNHGLTPTQAIMELCAFQDGLVNGDDNERHTRAVQMLRSTRLDLNRVIKELGGELPPGFRPAQSAVSPAQNNYLTAEQLDSILAYREAVRSITAELQSVIDDRDASGKPRFPGLQIPGVVELLKPRVLEIRELAPGTSYRDGLTRAYREYFGQLGLSAGDLSNGIQTRPPQSNQQQRAQPGGSISVRGRGSPPPRKLDGVEVPKTLEGQVALAYEMLERGESI